MNTRNIFTKLSIGIAVVALVGGMLYGGQRRQPAEKHNGETQTVQTKDGKTIVVTAEGRMFKADVADGTYKLTNGGAIRVRDRKVVWDAFGAVKRLKYGRWRGASGDPTG